MGNWSEYKYDATADGTYGGSADLDQDRTNNKVNEMTGITEVSGQSAWADPAYDAHGNMTTVPKPTALTATYTCKYDAWNRFVEVESGTNVVARYEYDGLNRRIKKHVDTSAPSSPDGTIDQYQHFFYNSSWQLLETCNSDTENTGPEDLQPHRQYVWSLRYIDAPICRDENTDTDGLCDDQTNYWLTDANMNVTGAFRSGEGRRHYVYDAYGDVTHLSNGWDSASRTSNDSVILFAGYYYDDETGLYHVRNRTYHPNLGRWMQRDPLRYPDGMSLYEYSRSTASLTDPLGLLPRPPWAGEPCDEPGREIWYIVDDPNSYLPCVPKPGGQAQWSGAVSEKPHHGSAYFGPSLVLQGDPAQAAHEAFMAGATLTLGAATGGALLEVPYAQVAVMWLTDKAYGMFVGKDNKAHVFTFTFDGNYLGWESAQEMYHEVSRQYSRPGTRQIHQISYQFVCECTREGNYMGWMPHERNQRDAGWRDCIYTGNVSKVYRAYYHYAIWKGPGTQIQYSTMIADPPTLVLPP